jgi:hypothetical protein
MKKGRLLFHTVPSAGSGGVDVDGFFFFRKYSVSANTPIPPIIVQTKLYAFLSSYS